MIAGATEKMQDLLNTYPEQKPFIRLMMFVERMNEYYSCTDKKYGWQGGEYCPMDDVIQGSIMETLMNSLREWDVIMRIAFKEQLDKIQDFLNSCVDVNDERSFQSFFAKSEVVLKEIFSATEDDMERFNQDDYLVSFTNRFVKDQSDCRFIEYLFLSRKFSMVLKMMIQYFECRLKYLTNDVNFNSEESEKNKSLIKESLAELRSGMPSLYDSSTTFAPFGSKNRIALIIISQCFSDKKELESFCKKYFSKLDYATQLSFKYVFVARLMMGYDDLPNPNSCFSMLFALRGAVQENAISIDTVMTDFVRYFHRTYPWMSSCQMQNEGIAILQTSYAVNDFVMLEKDALFFYDEYVELMSKNLDLSELISLLDSERNGDIGTEMNAATVCPLEGAGRNQAIAGQESTSHYAII